MPTGKELLSAAVITAGVTFVVPAVSGSGLGGAISSIGLGNSATGLLITYGTVLISMKVANMV